MATNTTFSSYDLPPLPSYNITLHPNLIPGFPDQYLTLALPILAYWITSTIFHILDTYDIFPQYRLHTPAEVLKRNHVTRWDVLRDVLIQQVLQTATGVALAAVEEPPMYGKGEYDVAVWARRVRLAQRAIPMVLGVVGVDANGLAKSLSTSHNMLAGALAGGAYPDLTQSILLHGQPTIAPASTEWEMLVAKGISNFLIPTLQFIIAICVLDTWQYFMHRAFHMNKYLYTTFHSRHHRLYVPYAYGALYNHPLEGFFMDTIGSGVAYLVSGLTVRQSMWFYTFSAIKTVDDHCGYSFPWDPLQHLTSNNAGYHDVHHQSWGIKSNFSQPFFTFWDSVLGTKWTGGDVSSRYERARIAAQKSVDADNAPMTKPITASTPDESSIADVQPYDSDKISPATQDAHDAAEPQIPSGKATQQALSSRQQVLEDIKDGGPAILAQETEEEIAVQNHTKQSPRRRTTSSGLRGFADRVGESLQGQSTGVLGVESGRR